MGPLSFKVDCSEYKRHQKTISWLAWQDKIPLNEIDSSYRRLGNSQDYQLDEVPRAGELVMLEYGIGGVPLKQRYFRVKEVLHHIQSAPGHQVAIILDDEEIELDF